MGVGEGFGEGLIYFFTVLLPCFISWLVGFVVGIYAAFRKPRFEGFHFAMAGVGGLILHILVFGLVWDVIYDYDDKVSTFSIILSFVLSFSAPAATPLLIRRFSALSRRKKDTAN